MDIRWLCRVSMPQLALIGSTLSDFTTLTSTSGLTEVGSLVELLALLTAIGWSLLVLSVALGPTKSTVNVSATDAAGIVVQIIVHQVCVSRVDPWIFVVLILGAVTLVIFVENIVVVDKGVGRIGEKLQQQLLHLRVKNALNLVGIVKVLTF